MRLVALLFFVVAAFAEAPLQSLSEFEIQNSRSLVLGSPEVGQLLQADSSTFRISAIEFSAAQLPVAMNSVRRARVILYSTKTNKAAVAFVDLTTVRVSKVIECKLEDVPLGREDIIEAGLLAIDDSKVTSLLPSFQTYDTTGFMFRGDAMCRQDRCVNVLFTLKGRSLSGVDIIVNLTKKTVTVRKNEVI